MNDQAVAIDLTTTPRDAIHADAMLNELRQHRVDNRVTDRDFFDRSDYLGRVASGEQNVAPPEPDVLVRDGEGQVVARLSAAEAADLDGMSPPSSGAGYQFNYCGRSPSTPEEIEFDTSTRQALVDAGVPARVGNYAYDAMRQLSERFGTASEADVQAHIASVRAELEKRWSTSFKSKIDAIDELVTGLKGPIGDVIAAVPWLVCDPLLLSMLDDLVQHRAKTK